MPQFILKNTDGFIQRDRAVVTWAMLDAFTQGYIECLFFTNTGCGDTEEWQTPEYQHRMREGQTDGALPNDVGFSDLHPDTLADIIKECAEFQRNMANCLAEAYKHGGDNSRYPYNETSAGHDFWYTRNHHGVGFWDRGLEDLGDNLTEAAEEYGECHVFFGDGESLGDGKVRVE